MPIQYTRNCTSDSYWSAEDLYFAITAVICSEVSLNVAAHTYMIRKLILKRRISTNNLEKIHRLSLDRFLCTFSVEKLSNQIKKQ